MAQKIFIKWNQNKTGIRRRENYSEKNSFFHKVEVKKKVNASL
jgi:hypothetical protein